MESECQIFFYSTERVKDVIELKKERMMMMLMLDADEHAYRIKKSKKSKKSKMSKMSKMKMHGCFDFWGKMLGAKMY